MHVQTAAKVSRARVLQAAGLAALAVVLSCAHVESRPEGGGGGGVSLAGAWVPELVEGNTFQTFNQQAADKRYLKLTGGTMTGSIVSTVGSGSAAVSMAAGRCVLLNSATGTCASGVFLDNDGSSTRIVNGATPLLTVANGSGLVSATISMAAGGSMTAGTYLKSTGVAAASLPTCNAGLEGATEQATDLDRLMSCNGTAWRGVVTEGALGGFQDRTTAAAHTVFDGDIVTRLAFVGFAWTLSAAGTTATAQTFTLRVRDATNAVTLCESAAIACDSGNGARVLCSSGSENMTTSARIQVEVRAASCDTAPVGNLAALYH